ncbi:MAG: hypothetical protein LBP95_04685 [Deltaproteobacteria bacterium]|jgi:hypothetical protein|nr:hypothetical protein [Deltaproteobacteria bacterium]
MNYKRRKYPLELKIWREPIKFKAGLDHLKKHMCNSGASEGWPVVFDRSKTKTWKEKNFWDAKQIGGLTTHIVGRSLYPNTTTLLKVCWLC